MNCSACGNCWKKAKKQGASERAMTAPSMQATMQTMMQAIAETSAARMVDCLVEGTLIGLFAGLMLRLVHRQNSGARFAAWFSALMAIAALPFLSDVAWLHRAGMGAPGVRPAITLPGSWALYLFAAWAATAGWGLIRVAVGLKQLRALRKSCALVDLSRLDEQVREILKRKQGTRTVALCTSDRVQVPTAIGLVAPMVVIPQWAMEELSADELNQILLHELAHLSRWDDWTNLAQKVVKALFFFHPAVWWIERNISIEREMACDEAVLAETKSPRAYAACLTHLAERTLVRRSLALAQAVLGRMKQTSLRVAKILDAKQPRGSKHIWRPAVPFVAGFAIVAMLLAAKEPRFVAFQDVHSEANISASVSPSMLRPIPAAFVTSEAKPHSALPLALHSTTHRMAAKHNAAPAMPRQRFEGFETSFAINDATVAPKPVSLKTPAANSLVSTETVFMWVEFYRPSSSQPAYEIHVWRLTVRRPAGHAAAEISRKET